MTTKEEALAEDYFRGSLIEYREFFHKTLNYADKLEYLFADKLRSDFEEYNKMVGRTFDEVKEKEGIERAREEALKLYSDLQYVYYGYLNTNEFRLKEILDGGRHVYWDYKG